ncbi:MAG: hypothetical protein V2I97_23195 [Desulfococcaceae bacterium]|jgi:hypothetical protein|nr:hypothetical protein [Desulfococcaceae bacterium]
MNWKFWEKKAGADAKFPKPQELPSGVGRNLVVNMKYDPDWVWNLKALVLPKENHKGGFYFRIYDPDIARAKSVTVKDYHSLENAKELILFEGWYDKNSWDMEIRDLKKEQQSEIAA